jgi:hypothetical protein
MMSSRIQSDLEAVSDDAPRIQPDLDRIHDLLSSFEAYKDAHP